MKVFLIDCFITVYFISGKEETLAQNESIFLNSVNLLCEVFHHMRLADGTVMNVLAVPILEYCDLLLSSQTHGAIQLLGKQLQVLSRNWYQSVGPNLYE